MKRIGKLNPLHQIDFYKADHRSQYPEGTTLVFSNLTFRRSRVPDVTHVVFFGLQYFIKEYLIKQWEENFFKRPKQVVVKEYKRRIENALGVGAITFNHVEELHDLGYLPLQIMALPEGTKVPLRVPALVYWNTDPKFFWLTNYLETILSCVLWGACTSATTAQRYKQILNKWADETVGNRNFVQWQGHDFSERGMFGLEAAMLSGAGHLLSFTGTDTVPAIDFLEKYYNADCKKELIGGSVPATEHSVMCMGGDDCEIDTIERLITKIYPKGIVSIVSDTWDFWKVLNEYLPQLKDKILSREGKLVVRPDSGDPVRIICGYKESEVSYSFGKYYLLREEMSDDLVELTEAEVKGAIQCLWETFGGTETEKGYKMLDSHIGLIYGDSITPERCDEICSRLADKGFCSDNVVLGIGSYTYNYVTRDTYGAAIKATYGEVNGNPRNIFKKPKTDDGFKNSAKGLLAVYQNDHNKDLHCLEEATWNNVLNCEFQKVFYNGVLTFNDKLSDIRYRLEYQGQ